MEQQEENAIIRTAKETAKQSQLVLDDMYQHRREYSSVDLAWRLMDVCRALLKVMTATLVAVSPEEEEAEQTRIKAVRKEERLRFQKQLREGSLSASALRKQLSELSEKTSFFTCNKVPATAAINKWSMADKQCVGEWLLSVGSGVDRAWEVPEVLQAYGYVALKSIENKEEEQSVSD